MRQVVWIAVALLVGLVAGSWGPRAEVRDLRARLGEQETAARPAQPEGADLEGVVRMLRIPAGPPAAPPPDEVPEEPPAADPDAPPGPAAAADGEPGETAPAPPRPEPPPREPGDMQADIDAAIEVFRVRAEASRNAFVANAELSRQQAADFDVLVAAMNVRLAQKIEDWARRLQTADDLSMPETGARMINDLSSALVVTYDELDRKMPSDWRQNPSGAASGFDLADFIDPSVALPLVGVQDRLREAGRRRNRRP